LNGIQYKRQFMVLGIGHFIRIRMMIASRFVNVWWIAIQKGIW